MYEILLLYNYNHCIDQVVFQLGELFIDEEDQCLKLDLDLWKPWVCTVSNFILLASAYECW